MVLGLQSLHSVQHAMVVHSVRPRPWRRLHPLTGQASFADLLPHTHGRETPYGGRHSATQAILHPMPC